MEKKITIYDVAQKAGVAISTVSRVLNQSPYVSENTRQKVARAIQDLDFRPQVSARKLASKQPQILAVAVPSFTTPFFNEVLKGVKDRVQKLDLDIVIYNTGSVNPEEGFKSFLDRGTADTLIIFSIEIDEEIHKRLQTAGIPVVLVGTHHDSYDYFEVDDYRGGYMAGDHLAQQNFKSAGMIRPAYESRPSRNRERGFRDALVNNNIELDEDFFVMGETTKHAGFTEESGFEAIYQLYDKDKFPEAIFCGNDTQAIGALNALARLGMRVPDDIAVMGYDNIKFSKYVDLTTVDQKMYSIGTQATELIEARIKDKDRDPSYHTIEPVLIPRNSTTNVRNK